MIEFSPESRSITTLGDFSQAVQRIVDTYIPDAQSTIPRQKSRLDSDFDDLCRQYPDLADQYLRAMADEYTEQNG